MLVIRYSIVARASACSRRFLSFSRATQSEETSNTSTSSSSTCSSTTAVHEPANFKPKRALLLSKMTRYEFDKIKAGTDSEEAFKKYLKEKGSDYEGVLERHNIHHEKLKDIQETLRQRNIETKLVGRMEYTEDAIDWADVVFSAGGDGTYLLAASKVKTRDKPTIGLNTDPIRSEGYLCLPTKYTGESGSHIIPALNRLLDGKFVWTFRQRIRVTMTGKHVHDDPVELHIQELELPRSELEYRFSEHVKEHETYNNVAENSKELPHRVLPVLALNEVFMGECLSARVSYYEISQDDSHSIKQKSSGVTVCTGTGSSSWVFNINHISTDTVKEILKISGSLGKMKIPCEDQLAYRVATQFNTSLRFEPSDLRMAYVVRDPIVNGVFHVPIPRGFAKKVTVRSRMWDGCLAIDGGVTFGFNDGAISTMEMFEEDALRTVSMSLAKDPQQN